MEKFICENCGNIFEAEPQKKEWVDRIYGPQWKWVAVSPCCNLESSVYTPPTQKKSKSSSTLPPCGHQCNGCHLQ